MICWLDMDGVLFDFNAAACRAHNRPLPYLTDPSTHGEHYLQNIWGMSQKEFWSRGDTLEFWTEMPKTPEADELVELVTSRYGVENVGVLTAPALSPHCVPGKRAALQYHFPQLVERMVYAQAKYLLAHSEAILIDDKNEQVDRFNAAGGWGILMPTYGNREHTQHGRAIEYMKEGLDGFERYSRLS